MEAVTCNNGILQCSLDHTNQISCIKILSSETVYYFTTRPTGFTVGNTFQPTFCPQSPVQHPPCQPSRTLRPPSRHLLVLVLAYHMSGLFTYRRHPCLRQLGTLGMRLLPQHALRSIHFVESAHEEPHER